MTDQNESIPSALAAVIRAAASPEVQQAQAMMLRRIALEGSVVASRIPPPRNITEVGGYLNLLAAGGHSDLRTTAIATALGLASPVSMGTVDSAPASAFARVGNDMGNVNAPGLLHEVPLRADLAAAWQARVQPRLRALGASLPLWASPPGLPSPGPLQAAPDALLAAGRCVWVAPQAALVDPETDPVSLGWLPGEPPDAPRVMLRTTQGDAVPSWNAYLWDATANALMVRPMEAYTCADAGPIVALAGFRFARAQVPAQRHDLGWARLINTTGLMPGVSRLGDELLRVWPESAVAASAFALRLNDVWDGADFVP
ncbi:MAG: hypothetical protein Q4G71_15090 [Pseudomonadota bacterium]|nr:hypothetical protein [Pseudomonadota bacterium]